MCEAPYGPFRQRYLTPFVSGSPDSLDILFINRSFWPDVEATGQLLTELCVDLARTHRVTVIAGRPNFVAWKNRGWLRLERHEGVEVLRVNNRVFSKRSFLGRVIGLSSYLVLAAWTAFRHRRPDVIVVETDPPVLGALGALLKWWHRRPMVYYLQDLYPEVGVAMGRLKPGPLTALLRWATQLGLRRADRVVVLGEDMRRRVLHRGVNPAKVEIVPNWVDTQSVKPLNRNNGLRRDWGLDDRFVVMYSGNLGLSQNLEQVLETARCLRDEPVQFVLIGEGAEKAHLVSRAEEWGLTNVRFLPYQPKERLAESLGAADVHLIPLRRGLGGYLVPSKLYGILAAGRPFIAAVDADSEVANVAKREKCGLLVEPDGPAQLAESIRWCLTHPEELHEMGRRGRELAEMRFDRSHCVARFADVLQGFGERSRKA